VTVAVIAKAFQESLLQGSTSCLVVLLTSYFHHPAPRSDNSLPTPNVLFNVGTYDASAARVADYQLYNAGSCSGDYDCEVHCSSCVNFLQQTSCVFILDNKARVESVATRFCGCVNSTCTWYEQKSARSAVIGLGVVCGILLVALITLIIVWIVKSRRDAKHLVTAIQRNESDVNDLNL
jgi:hypothetical protein